MPCTWLVTSFPFIGLLLVRSHRMTYFARASAPTLAVTTISRLSQSKLETHRLWHEDGLSVEAVADVRCNKTSTVMGYLAGERSTPLRTFFCRMGGVTRGVILLSEGGVFVKLHARCVHTISNIFSCHWHIHGVMAAVSLFT